MNAHMSYLLSVPHTQIVRHEDVMQPKEATAWIQKLIRKYKLQPKGGGLKPVTQYKNAEWKRFDPNAAMKASIWFNSRELAKKDSNVKEIVKLVNRHMDAQVESIMGYPMLPNP